MRIISFAGTSNAAYVSLKKIVYEVGSANIREILLFYTEKSEQTKEKIKNEKNLHYKYHFFYFHFFKSFLLNYPLLKLYLKSFQTHLI